MNIMKVRKQFQPISRTTICTIVTDHVGKFVPELSMPIKDILSQFAFVDNIRLGELMKHGYFGADNDSDFDLPEFDLLDIAEKEQIYNQAKDFVTKFENERRAQANNQAPETAPDADAAL